MTKPNDADVGDVLIERMDEIAYLRINRPQVSNAVGPPTMLRLCEAIDTVVADPAVKAIVLGHTGKHFIAGADFAFLQDLTSTATTEVKKQIYEAFQGAAKRLHLCGKPTVAAIGGAAITVGCELAIACDFRIVTKAALFQESWIRMGLIPPLGGFKVLPSLVGMGLAKEMILRALPISGERAIAVGLATQMVEASALETTAMALARELGALAPLAYQASKEGLRRGTENSLDESWASSLLAQSLLIGSADFTEGVTAVKQRRAPVFKGQ